VLEDLDDDVRVTALRAFAEAVAGDRGGRVMSRPMKEAQHVGECTTAPATLFWPRSRRPPRPIPENSTGSRTWDRLHVAMA
jgi:hypothetical protein